MNTILHLHTMFSLNDGTIVADQLRKKAEEMGCKAVASTDHGTLMAVQNYAAAFAGSEVKYIPGIEAYIDGENGKREHLVILPMDNVGYKALYKCVTASQKHLNNGFPTMTLEMLDEHFGPGKEGHGHVLALSACMIGVLGAELLRNWFLEEEAQKQEKKGLSVDIDIDDYNRLKKQLEGFETEKAKLSERKEALQALKSKKFTKRIREVEKLANTAEYDKIKAELDAEIEESANAGDEYVKVKADESKLNKQASEIKSQLKKYDLKVSKIESYTKKASEIRESMCSDEEMYDKAYQKAVQLQWIFGEGNFYAELQYHGIEAEKIVFPQVVKIAKEIGLPLVATNDAHILTKSEDERRRRQIVRSLRFNKWEDENIGDDELYVKTDDELIEALTKIIDRETVLKAIKGNDDVADRCCVTFEKENHYPRWRGEKDAEATLWDLARQGQKNLFPNGWSNEYEERLIYEMKVIKKLDVIDYLCIVADFLEYGRLLGKIDLESAEFQSDPFNIEKLKKMASGRVGMGTGYGRGSAVGSLVCYLCGITGADPIKHNLLFERFLNTERVTMPDIDSDFKTDARPYVIEFVRNKYGNDAVCGIMTLQVQGAKMAVRSCARLLGDCRFGQTNYYYALGSEICSNIPNEIGVKLSDCVEKLKEQYSGNPDALAIINDAVLAEGTVSSTGTHAAGVIIADNGDVGEYMPLMYSKDGQLVTQCEKDYCEDLGLLKMDFLGLRNLDIITETLRSIYRNTGKKIEIEKVSLEDKDVFDCIFSKGNTDSVFQFESDGMKALLRRFRPSSVEDLILLNAMYRPGPLQYIDAVCDTKAGKASPEYVIPEMGSVLGVTYGKPIYQEQIMAIFNKFAGFSLGEADIIRRYMSKKKTEKMMAYQPKFISGLIAHGATKEKAEEFWNELVEFSKYAFNKSHSTAYAITAYYTAWLKYHYPKEYLCAVLNDTEFTKVGAIISELGDLGYTVLPPDINSSPIDFLANKDNSISFGLSKIKGVASGAKSIIAERENGLYASFEDFLSRTGCPKDYTEALIKSGAMDCFESKSSPAFTRRKLCESISSGAYTDDDDLTVLVAEKSVTGAFLTRNPTHGYQAKNKLSDVCADKRVQIVGIITKYKDIVTKAGQKMAVMTIEDETGSIDACCFPQRFSECCDLLGEGRVLSISGTIKLDTRSSDDEEKLQLIIWSAEKPIPGVKSMTIHTTKPIGLFMSLIGKYVDNTNGIPLYYNNGNRTIYMQTKVRSDILRDKDIGNFLIVTT